jgi:hypothetical protein
MTRAHVKALAVDRLPGVRKRLQGLPWRRLRTATTREEAMSRLYIEPTRRQGLHVWWKGRGVHIFLRKGCLKRRVSLDRAPWPERKQ